MEFATIKRSNRWARRVRRVFQAAGAIGLMLMLAACGDSPGYSYTVGGLVSGMAGSGLVLQNNGGDDLSVTVNGSFSFANAVADGGAYAVTVKTQPAGLGQVCTVVNGTGVTHGMVTTIQINCVQPPPRFAVDSATSVNYAYAVKYSGMTNTAYTVDSATGALTLNGTAGTTGTNPNGVTVATVGTNKYAYVPNVGSGTISAYAIGSGGALSELSGSPVTAGTNPFSVTVATVGTKQYAYVPNFGSNNISVYSIVSDGVSDGTLLKLTDSPFAAGTNPHSVRIATVNGSPYAYVSNAGSANISIYSIGSDGALMAVTALPVTAGTNPAAVEINPAGTYAYVVNTGASTISVYTIQQNDVTDGAKKGTLILSSTVATSSNPLAFKMNSTGAYAYVPCFRSNAINVYTIGSDGALTAGTTVSSGTNPYDFTTVQIGSNVFAYAVNYGSNNISVYSISSGALTAVETKDAGTNPYAVTISKTSSDVYVAHVLNAGSGNISTYTINSSTGALTLVGTVAY